MCLAKRKANSGPVGEAAGAEGSGPAGKAAGADIEWHDEGAVPPFGPIYPLSEKELQALQEYLRIEHLGCHLSSEGIAMSSAKIQSIENWAELRSTKNVLQFLGSAEKRREKMGITSSASPKGGEWKTAIRMRYGLLEHLGCHLSSEGIAMSSAKIQSIENWAELRSTKNVLQFLGSAEKRRKP
jgi:hypothetical protein